MARAFPSGAPGLSDQLSAAFRRAVRRLRERRCRLSIRPRALDDGRLVITMLEGPELALDRNDLGLSHSLAGHGYWEMWLTEAIEAVLQPGMVAIDIGANLGYFTMLMAKCVGATGAVHAFEPNPAMTMLLRHSIVRNGFETYATVHDDPLWDADSLQASLHVPDGEPKNAFIVEGVDGNCEVLTTRRLDSLFEVLEADVIKIDVEGAEEAIWRGMSGLFARGRPLIIFLEFTPIRYEHPMRFIDAITEQGFSLAELSVSHGVRAVTREQLLAGPADEDRMLVLRRSAQA